MRSFWQRCKRLVRRWLRSSKVEYIPVEFADSLAHLPRPINISEALRTIHRQGKQEGIELGRKEAYACPYFPKETDPGLYVCPMYRTEPSLPAIMQLKKPGDFARMHHRLTVELGRPPTDQTIKYQTIRLGREEAS